MHRALTEANSQTNALKIALAKLELNNHETIQFKYACISIRVSLDLDSMRNPSAAQLESRLVEEYMRVVFAVPSHRLFMRTGTPSEPILAEAAARILNKPTRRGTRIVAIEVLQHACRHGHISKCDAGELVFRLLSILARDVALKAAFGDPASADMHFQQPVCLVDFLCALVKPEYRDTIKQACPVGRPSGSSLETALSTAYVNFSHFAVAGDAAVAGPDYVYQFAMRGAALQCRAYEQEIDGFIPVIWVDGGGEPGDGVISRATCSRIQYRVKNRQTAVSTLVSPTVGAADFPGDRPAVTLFVELGSVESGVEVLAFDDYYTQSGRADAHAKHYQIILKGLDIYSFELINGSHELREIQKFLQPATPFDEFQRNDDATCRAAMRQQKPDFAEDNVTWGK